MARVLMVGSEATPFVKTGGLADVLGSLPAALVSEGHDVAVFVPKYRQVELFAAQRVYHDLLISIGPTTFRTAIDEVVQSGVRYYFLDCPELFARDGIYTSAGRDYPDNHVRFGVFCRGVLELVRRVFRPHILHCHDWQAALVPAYVRHLFAGDPTFLSLRMLFTIHNLGYQGIFGASAIADLGFGPSMFTPSTLEYWGSVNLMKGGILWSDAINTVSPTYAEEIQTPEYGFGLDGLLRSRSAVLSGILNGVDYGEWNPETDRHLPAHYSASSLEGKRVCKQELLQRYGLPEDMTRPVLGIVSRFATQKGFDLIADAAADLLAEDVALVVLGSAASRDEQRYERMFLDMRDAAPDRVGVKIGYDNGLAHLIEAGSDIFLMPSRYEPCGLNQMYSLRYGTPPVVRATGGLNDTIDETDGFKFYPYTGGDFLAAVRDAVAAFQDAEGWLQRVGAGMARDFSWAASARSYGDLYNGLRQLPPQRAV